MEEVAEQLESNAVIEKKSKQANGEPIYQKELELSYKWSLQDLNNDWYV